MQWLRIGAVPRQCNENLSMSNMQDVDAKILNISHQAKLKNLVHILNINFTKNKKLDLEHCNYCCNGIVFGTSDGDSLYLAHKTLN